MSVPIARPISRTKVILTLLQNSIEETKAIVEGLNARSLIFLIPTSDCAITDEDECAVCWKSVT